MNVFKTLVKVIKILAYILIGYYLFDWTVAQFIPIRFVDIKITQGINLCSIYILPVSILLTLLGLFEKVRERRYILFRVIVTTSSAIVLFFILTRLGTAILLGSVRVSGTVLFENRDNRSIRIVEKYDNAGLLGEGPKEIFKERPLTSLFIIEAKIDTNELIKNEWIAIERP
jgi:hypothetical protein